MVKVYNIIRDLFLQRGELIDELSPVTSVAPTGRISRSSVLQESRVLHPSRRGDPI